MGIQGQRPLTPLLGALELVVVELELGQVGTGFGRQRGIGRIAGRGLLQGGLKSGLCPGSIALLLARQPQVVPGLGKLRLQGKGALKGLQGFGPALEAPQGIGQVKPARRVIGRQGHGPFGRR